ncbi:MAG TPA: thiamine pyrophosphate-dependent enzyme [Beijerinckia sp.]|jgi:2-oxoisovalerate dehydrogenase E1 component|nr:thiamine pyrophosphate-dependent enzyme [Beijerinckia sp.]
MNKIDLSVELDRIASPLSEGQRLAEQYVSATRQYLADEKNFAEILCALRIRAVENSLYELFGKGKLHGTIHTCVGQEFSGVLVGKYLREGDFITSNHRCHGHFIAATREWKGLVDEIIGNADGVCAGIGSSQHLWAENFISNGQQGGLLPVAAGVALDRKEKGAPNVAVSFIGEGTLGEGVVYETLNLDALWGLPHIVICENNFYSQSTPQTKSVAGSIVERAAAFGIEAVQANIWDLAGLDAILAEAFERGRTKSQPTFIALATYRLNPHSKGDDLRDKAEIESFRSRDPVTLAFTEFDRYKKLYAEIVEEVTAYAEEALSKPALQAERYFADELPRADPGKTSTWTSLNRSEMFGQRIVQQLNKFYNDWLQRDQGAFFVGEDIEDPYGGAFKISKGFTTSFPTRVRTTPISESAITGIGVGLAISGRRAFVEIMFGDFITYAFDQIINNAAKFHHMYNRNISCPVVVRTPMGGRRGYGPTHSQSLERFLIGIDNCVTLSLNSLVEVEHQLAGLGEVTGPAVLLENKSDYTNKTYEPSEGFIVESNHALFPTLRVRPEYARPTITLVSYGGMARYVADRLEKIFMATDTVPELIVPTSLHPVDIEPIAQSVSQTGRIAIIEEGASFGSAGSEILAQLYERLGPIFQSTRLGSRPVPIPSAPSLEEATLPSLAEICTTVNALVEKRAYAI